MAAQRADDWRRLKREIRARARANRRNQPNKDQLSRQICRTLAALPEYLQARTLLCYVDMRCEVRTRHFLPTAWEHGKRVIVPYCVGSQLKLFLLESVEELAPGTYQIPEPRAELRGRPDRKADIARVDLVVVPGVAFDRRGGRLGWGKGYYDRLLRRARPETPLVALAFECQLVGHVPVEPHDVRVHKVITEKAAYEAAKPRSAENPTGRDMP